MKHEEASEKVYLKQDEIKNFDYNDRFEAYMFQQLLSFISIKSWKSFVILRPEKLARSYVIQSRINNVVQTDFICILKDFKQQKKFPLL